MSTNTLDKIDDQFVDVDFEHEYLEYGRGANPTNFLMEELFSSYEDSVELMSDTEIREACEQQEAEGGLEELVTRVYDQGREGACVGNATCQANQLVQAKQFGEDQVVELAAMSVYKKIGRSASSGATVPDGLKCVQTYGALPLDTATNRQKFGDHVMNNVGFSQRYPAGSEATAALFQAKEAHVVRSEQGLKTALARQEPVTVGREGHSITYLRLVFQGNSYKVIYVNSWSPGWGFAYGDHSGGFGADSRSQVLKSANWAFVLRTVRGRDA